jgi:hypothetical protein
VRRRLSIAVPYVALTFLFGGPYGALAGVALVALWVALGPFGRALWALAVLLLVAAPFAILAQGATNGVAAGADFGGHHMIAHVLVGLALAAAGLAGMAELVSEREAGSRGTDQAEHPED